MAPTETTDKSVWGKKKTRVVPTQWDGAEEPTITYNDFQKQMYDIADNLANAIKVRIDQIRRQHRILT